MSRIGVRLGWRDRKGRSLTALPHSLIRLVQKGGTMVNKPWSGGDITFLTENYARLETREIAERLGRSPGATRLKAHNLGLEKFPDDISFFTKWTEESTYIIGFWAADGYVNVRDGKGIRFSISQTGDVEILRRIQALVGKGTICWIRQSESWRYEWSSAKLYPFLCDLFGRDVRHKSRILQWPSIPDGYVRHFLRGYCDGDAHIGIDSRDTPQIRVSSGSEKFIDSVLFKVCKLVGIQGTRSTTKLGTHLALYSSIKATCLAKWLYSDCWLAMDKKLESATEVASVKQRRVNRASVMPRMMEVFPALRAYGNLG